MLSFLFAWIASSNQDANPLVVMMPLFLIVLIFYFLMIRPQAKRQKAQRAMLENLQKGDDVIAAGGIKGKISGIKEKEDIIILKIDNDVKIEILKSSVSTVLNKE